MKTLILGDIHGRTIWKDIIKKENPDKVIFLGDYVSTHYDISDDVQIENLEDILSYKKSHFDSVILLRGNHDLEALGYDQCYPNTSLKIHQFMDEIEDEFTELTQWIYIPPVDDVHKPIIFSHAGITQPWFDKVKKNKLEVKELEDINNLRIDNFLFRFSLDRPFDQHGTGVTQPCTWIRPSTLIDEAVPGIHIVGHTTFNKIRHEVNEENPEIELWLCDALENEYYLILEDDIFITKNL